MKDVWLEINKESDELGKSYKKQLTEVEGKIESIEESYFVTKDMNRETYDKFFERFNKEREENWQTAIQTDQWHFEPDDSHRKGY